MRLVALLVLAWAQAAWAVGPLERPHPKVSEGLGAYAAGRYEDALAAFEEAKKERPDDPTVEFNRGDALMKLGRLDEAREAFARVAESRNAELKQKATYNLGNLHAAKGEREQALKAWRRALALNPKDEQARHNYEAMLRNLPPPRHSPDAGEDGGDGGEDGGSDAGMDGGTPDGGQDGGQDGGMDGGQDGGQDGGEDAGQDGGPGDAGQGDAGPPQQGQPDGGQGDAGQADAGQQPGEQQPGDGGVDAGTGEEEEEQQGGDGGVSQAEIDRQQAERLLDAMKQNEKNLQLWRFQQKKRPRKPDEKDW